MGTELEIRFICVFNEDLTAKWLVILASHLNAVAHVTVNAKERRLLYKVCAVTDGINGKGATQLGSREEKWHVRTKHSNVII